MGENAGRIERADSPMGCEDFVGKKVDGKGAEGEDSGVKREAQADYQPIGNVKAKNTLEFQFVDLASLSQLILFFGMAFQCPVND